MKIYCSSFMMRFSIFAWFLFFACACSSDMSEDVILSYRLEEDISVAQRFTWGESRIFAASGVNVKQVSVLSCPKGWTAVADANEIKVTAPLAVSGTVPTTGEIIFLASYSGKSETLTLPVEIPASMIISLNRPTLFDDSEVVWAKKEKGDTLAQICREFVRMENVTTGQGIQTIVVYLYDSSSKTFSKGLVAANGGAVNHDVAAIR